MKTSFDESIRNRCAVELFHSVMRTQMAGGLSYSEARSAAYEAVEARYFISRKTFQNIMSRDSTAFRSEQHIFFEDSNNLIKILEDCNADLAQMIERNTYLIETLKSIQ